MRAIRVSIAVAMLLAMLAIQTTFATHWTSRTVVARIVAQECAGGTRIEAPQSGVPYIVFYDGDQGTITFTVNGTLSFATDEASHVLTSLLIAGGPTNAVLYTYAPGVSSDSGLTAPTNPGTGTPYGSEFVCIYTGTGGTATLIVEKQTDPDGAVGSFGFTSTIPGKANFNLTDGQSNSTQVTPGVYAVTETVPAGWTLSDITCSGDTIPPNSSYAGSTATFNAQAGETITCVFTNTSHASLTIVKATDPASDSQDFDFDLTGQGLPADLDLDTDGGNATLPSQQTFNLNAAQLGAHTVTESATAGWSLTALACTGGGGDGSTSLVDRRATLDIDAGENVVCTFTNTELPAAVAPTPTPRAAAALPNTASADTQGATELALLAMLLVSGMAVSTLVRRRRVG